MKYMIQISYAPGQSASSWNAYEFIQTALKEGHEVLRVFFYHDGVYHGVCPRLPSGRAAFFPDWIALVRVYNIALVVCTSALERRGIHPTNLTEGFQTGGLGLWMDASLKADRVIFF